MNRKNQDNRGRVKLGMDSIIVFCLFEALGI